MKSQLIPSIFIVLLVSSVILGFTLYNIIYGKKYRLQLFEIKTIDVARNLMESFKSFTSLSFVYSIDQALREAGENGGSYGSAPWICNGPNPMPAELSKGCMENYTKHYLNVYFEKFNTSLPLKIVKISNFTQVIYQINIPEVYSGKYDEGGFLVNASGASVEIVSENLKMLENFNISQNVTRNRYWYLFRKFTDWANSDPLTSCICSNIGCACSSASERESCSSCSANVLDCGEAALEKLQNEFDKNVECSYQLGCCEQGYGPECLPEDGCLTWITTNCKKSCEHTCTQLFTSFSSFNSFASKSLSNPLVLDPPTTNCKAEYWYEARLSVSYIFTCKDKKYYVSSPQGPEPLTFSVTAYVYLRAPKACFSIVSCDCPKDYKSCDECKPIGRSCTQCHS